MKIHHTVTTYNEINSLPAYLLPPKMTWDFYKQGEFLPNGYLVTRDTWYGYAAGKDHQKRTDGYERGIPRQDYKLEGCRMTGGLKTNETFSFDWTDMDDVIKSLNAIKKSQLR